MAGESTASNAGRVINRNPLLYGPGPVRRESQFYYARLSRTKGPAYSFMVCAAHGIVLGMIGGFGFKWLIGDKQIKMIEDYYKENPPR